MLFADHATTSLQKVARKAALCRGVGSVAFFGGLMLYFALLETGNLGVNGNP